jgi:hypothetical protein
MFVLQGPISKKNDSVLQKWRLIVVICSIKRCDHIWLAFFLVWWGYRRCTIHSKMIITVWNQIYLFEFPVEILLGVFCFKICNFFWFDPLWGFVIYTLWINLGDGKGASVTLIWLSYIPCFLQQKIILEYRRFDLMMATLGRKVNEKDYNIRQQSIECSSHYHLRCIADT